MKNLFNTVKMTKPSRNAFDLSHDVKLSCNMGELVPIMVQECVPGDKFNIGCESLLRFAPLVSPVMHRMDVSMHYFFVPNRILWNHWEQFITNTPIDGLAPAFPVLNVHDESYHSLYDYLGIPRPLPDVTEKISALPIAAYQCIFNEYYRDQNLQVEIDYHLVDGNNDTNLALGAMRRRAWEHDYFTSALPFAQKGAAVDIPLGSVTLRDDWHDNPTGPQPHFEGPDNANAMGQISGAESFGGLGFIEDEAITQNFAYNPEGSLEVGSTTINDLRRAFRLQEWLEKNARGGTRYIENILAHFGVRSSDKRLQRPEYITGTKSPVVISEVVNTAGDGELPQGNMAGHGISVTAGKYGNYFCEEHGYIIGVMSVLPKTAYQQGIPKHFLKHTDPFQYYWPDFAHIGEQAVLNRELYAFTNNGGDTFGYVPRYAEYKYNPSRVAGDFRTTLDFWHLGRIFGAPPALNSQFIECNPSTRIFAVEDPDVEKLYCHVLNKVRAIRPMPKFGTPTF